MRPIVRTRVESWLLGGTVVGLFGCPLLLDDGFSLATLTDADGGGACIGDGCVPPSNEAGGSAETDGGGGSGDSGSAGTSGAGGAGATGSAGSGGAGNAGTGGTGSAGGGGEADAGSAGEGGTGSAGTGTGGGTSADAPCWTLELTPESYDPESNCIGVHGTSTVTTDTGTTLALSYDNGDPCFTGTVASTGWGAVYELTFAGDDDGGSVWNASATSVAGFEFAYRGSEQPSSLRVLYKDPSGVDNCDVIGPGTTQVPFTAAHPGCSATGNTVDTARLVEMILAFVPRSTAYDVDFCMQIRALD